MGIKILYKVVCILIYKMIFGKYLIMFIYFKSYFCYVIFYKKR